MTDFDDDLKSQRRNLLLVSSFLIIFDFAEVNVTKVGILGTDFVVGQPQVLIVSAWILWAYFLLRYYQYWRPHNQRRIRREYSNYVSGELSSHVASKYDDSAGLKGILHSDPSAKKFKFFRRFSNTNAGMDTEVLETWSRPKTMKLKTRAVIHVIFTSQHFTDQIVPFLVAAAAPLVSIAVNCKNIASVA